MIIDEKHCSICGTPLSPHQARAGFLCGNMLCRWKYESVPEGRRCAVCGRPLATRELARRTCASDACMRAWHVDRPLARKQQQRLRLEADAVVFRDEAAAAVGLPDASSFRVTLVPHTDAAESPLPDARRDAIRTHLTRIAALAVAHREGSVLDDDALRLSLPVPEPPPPGLQPEVGTVMLEACGGCRGFCCVGGGEHAYLTPATMLHYIDEHPGQSVQDIVDAYLSCVGEQTMEGRCVYQRERGCALPPAMRSDTCNSYYCDALLAFRRSQAEGGPVRAFFVPAHDGQLEPGIFASPGFVQIVPPRSASRDAPPQRG